MDLKDHREADHHGVPQGGDNRSGSEGLRFNTRLAPVPVMLTAAPITNDQ
jgi:hypothetical protein